MKKGKITVLRKTLHEDLASEYVQRETGLCEAFEIGQEFIVESPTKQPEAFSCGWAWNDIHRGLLTLMQGGNFGSTWKWTKTDDTMITCCTDGIRPVIFKLEVFEE